MALNKKYYYYFTYSEKISILIITDIPSLIIYSDIPTEKKSSVISKNAMYIY